MVATLTGIFGVEHLTLAEDVVQEALARALQTWPFYGVPKNPSAWLIQTARNRALDVVRRQKNFRDKEAEIIRVMEREVAASDETIFSEEEIADDRLRFLFVCCHPQIPADAQVALALKTLCGFGVPPTCAMTATTTRAGTDLADRIGRRRSERLPPDVGADDRGIARLQAGRSTDRDLRRVRPVRCEGLLRRDPWPRRRRRRQRSERARRRAHRHGDGLAFHHAGQQEQHAVQPLLAACFRRGPVQRAPVGRGGRR